MLHLQFHIGPSELMNGMNIVLQLFCCLLLSEIAGANSFHTVPCCGNLWVCFTRRKSEAGMGNDNSSP